jgi:hypothetical protein
MKPRRYSTLIISRTQANKYARIMQTLIIEGQKAQGHIRDVKSLAVTILSLCHNRVLCYLNDLNWSRLTTQ